MCMYECGIGSDEMVTVYAEELSDDRAIMICKDPSQNARATWYGPRRELIGDEYSMSHLPGYIMNISLLF